MKRIEAVDSGGSGGGGRSSIVSADDASVASGRRGSMIDWLSTTWGVRSKYKWFVFTDVLMVCQPNRFGNAERTTFRTLFELSELVVMPSTGSAAAGASDVRSSCSVEEVGTPSVEARVEAPIKNYV